MPELRRLGSPPRYFVHDVSVKCDALFSDPASAPIRLRFSELHMNDAFLRTATVVILFSTASFCSPTAHGTIADVKNDVAVIYARSTDLRTAVSNLPENPAFEQVQNVDTLVSALIFAADNGTGDVKNTPPFSPADGRSIFSDVQKIPPVTKNALNMIVTREPGLTALSVENDIHQILVTLSVSTVSYGDVLISSAPDEDKAEATLLRDDLLSAFDKASAEFA